MKQMWYGNRPVGGVGRWGCLAQSKYVDEDDIRQLPRYTAYLRPSSSAMDRRPVKLALFKQASGSIIVHTVFDSGEDARNKSISFSHLVWGQDLHSCDALTALETWGSEEWANPLSTAKEALPEPTLPRQGFLKETRPEELLVDEGWSQAYQFVISMLQLNLGKKPVFILGDCAECGLAPHAPDAEGESKHSPVCDVPRLFYLVLRSLPASIRKQVSFSTHEDPDPVEPLLAKIISELSLVGVGSNTSGNKDGFADLRSKNRIVYDLKTGRCSDFQSSPYAAFAAQSMAQHGWREVDRIIGLYEKAEAVHIGTLDHLTQIETACQNKADLLDSLRLRLENPELKRLYAADSQTADDLLMVLLERKPSPPETPKAERSQPSLLPAMPPIPAISLEDSGPAAAARHLTALLVRPKSDPELLESLRSSLALAAGRMLASRECAKDLDAAVSPFYQSLKLKPEIFWLSLFYAITVSPTGSNESQPASGDAASQSVALPSARTEKNVSIGRPVSVSDRIYLLEKWQGLTELQNNPRLEELKQKWTEVESADVVGVLVSGLADDVRLAAFTRFMTSESACHKIPNETWHKLAKDAHLAKRAFLELSRQPWFARTVPSHEGIIQLAEAFAQSASDKDCLHPDYGDALQAAKRHLRGKDHKQAARALDRLTALWTYLNNSDAPGDPVEALRVLQECPPLLRRELLDPVLARFLSGATLELLESNFASILSCFDGHVPSFLETAQQIYARRKIQSAHADVPLVLWLLKQGFDNSQSPSQEEASARQYLNGRWQGFRRWVRSFRFRGSAIAAPSAAHKDVGFAKCLELVRSLGTTPVPSILASLFLVHLPTETMLSLSISELWLLIWENRSLMPEAQEARLQSLAKVRFLLGFPGGQECSPMDGLLGGYRLQLQPHTHTEITITRAAVTLAFRQNTMPQLTHLILTVSETTDDLRAKLRSLRYAMLHLAKNSNLQASTVSLLVSLFNTAANDLGKRTDPVMRILNETWADDLLSLPPKLRRQVRRGLKESPPALDAWLRCLKRKSKER